VKILNVARWDDGDYTWDVRDPAGGGLVHIELSPPFLGGLRIPNKGETVQPYGMVRFDPDHNWYEIHPVRCWKPGECVPMTASYVRNGAPPGTPKPGGYVQGGAVPLFVPITGSGGGGGSTGTLTATFQPTGGNDWWVQVKVTASKPLAGVDAAANGGAWVPLDKSSWGDWVKSFYAKGEVKFRARATDGSTKVSDPFPWPPGSASAASAAPASRMMALAAPIAPPALFADFVPGGGEGAPAHVAVQAGRPIVALEVQADYGQWRPMERGSSQRFASQMGPGVWDYWSSGYLPPMGSLVVFRATAEDGAVAYSHPFAWAPDAD
jgi:hypothetical protein